VVPILVVEKIDHQYQQHQQHQQQEAVTPLDHHRQLLLRVITITPLLRVDNDVPLYRPYFLQKLWLIN